MAISGGRIEDGNFLQGPKFGALYEGIQGNGVIQGYEVSQSGTGDLKIAVSGGSAVVGGQIVTVSGMTFLTHGAADGTYPRYDNIAISGDGTPFIQAGTAGSIPKAPDGINTTVPISINFIGSTATTVLNGNITDTRGFAPHVANIALQNVLAIQEKRNLRTDYNANLLFSGTNTNASLFQGHQSGINFHFDDFYASGLNDYVQRGVGKPSAGSGTNGTFGAVGGTLGQIGSPRTIGTPTYIGKSLTFGQAADDMQTAGSWTLLTGGGPSSSAIGVTVGSSYFVRGKQGVSAAGSILMRYDGVEFKGGFTGSVIGISWSDGDYYSKDGTVNFKYFLLGSNAATRVQLVTTAVDGGAPGSHAIQANQYNLVIDTGAERASLYKNNTRVLDNTDLSTLAGEYYFMAGIEMPGGHSTGTGSMFFGPLNYLSADIYPNNTMQVTTEIGSFDTATTHVFLDTFKQFGWSPSGTPWSFQSASGIQFTADSGTTWQNIKEATFEKIIAPGSQMMLRFLPNGSTFRDPTTFVHETGTTGSSTRFGFTNMANFPSLTGYAMYHYNN